MLGKLMKYEFKSTGRVFLPLFAALIILSVVNRIFMSLDFDTPKNIGIVVSVILMVGIAVLAFILTLQRFNKNLMQNEGYLMNTLPVKTDSLILSKLFVSTVWYIACFVVVLAAILIMAVTNFSFSDLADAFRRFGELVPREQFQAVVLVIEAIITIVLYLFCGILMMYACMSLSMLVNKRRGMFMFGSFIVICIILQVLVYVFLKIINAFHIGRIFDGLSGFGQTQVFLLIYALIGAAFGAALYFITRYMLKSRLNLQ